MRRSEIEKRKGEICILDLINGAQVTTEVKDVVEDEEGTFAIVGQLLVFQVSVEVRDPRRPPHPTENPVEHRVRNVFYGYPLFESKDDQPIDIDHILMAHDCHADMAKVYTKVTTGIEIADAGTLNQLDAAAKGGKIALK